MSLNCQINFEQNVNGVYFAGQLVSGNVVLNLNKSKTIRAICLRITGVSKCHWTETQTTGTGQSRITRTVHFNGREDYVSTSTYLVPQVASDCFAQNKSIIFWRGGIPLDNCNQRVQVVITSEHDRISVNCEIQFAQNVNGVYFAGQLVSGHVVLNLSKTKKLKAICLRITGVAKCHWTESETVGHGKDQTTRTIYFDGREDYVSTSTYLVPQGISGDGFQLLAGSHRYAFACALPTNLPTSFEGTYGHIRYTAKVILERPWKFDHTYQVAFTVLRELNLNFMAPHLRAPAQIEYTKFFCCGPCRSAPLIITASVPQTGYVPGQVITIDAKVNNVSSTTVYCVQFMIRKIVTYYSQTPYRKSKVEFDVITKHKDAGVAQKSNGTFQVQLTVPPVPATNDDGVCRTITISYEIKVEAKVSGAHGNPTVTIPITIGTTPLSRHIEYAGSQPNIGLSPIVSQPVSQSIPSAPPILTPGAENSDIMGLKGVGGAAAYQMNHLDVDPPSYEETMNGSHQILDEDDAHPMGSHSYTPRYPVYHFGRQNAPVVIQQIGFEPVAGASGTNKY